MEELRAKAIISLQSDREFSMANQHMQEYMIGKWVSAYLDGELAEITRSNNAIETALRGTQHIINETQKYFQ